MERDSSREEHTGMSSVRTRLRERIARKPILVAPGTGDALGARLIQAAGFEAVYMSGLAVEGTYGKPDVGFLGMSEVAARAAQIVDAVDVPVLVDTDTGYGNAINVIRTVREFERAGVSAIQLEDQALPKRCGSMAGKRLVSTEEMVGKIRAALDTRHDPDMLVIARTDAAAIHGLDEAIRRATAYAKAGADLLMVLGPYAPADVRRLAAELPGPFVYLNSESLTMPMIQVNELDALGVRMVIFPIAILLTAARAMRETLREIKEKGTTLGILDRMLSFDEFNGVVGLPAVKDWERQYGEGA
jgi:2-methylisocitrate lyase-like PEP mutase family enzyme